MPGGPSGQMAAGMMPHGPMMPGMWRTGSMSNMAVGAGLPQQQSPQIKRAVSTGKLEMADGPEVEKTKANSNSKFHSLVTGLMAEKKSSKNDNQPDNETEDV